MRWILYSAASEGRAFSREPALFIANRPWLATATAAFLLGMELVFPLALFLRPARPVVVVAALVLHAGTWVLLGLDYWLWAAVVAVVFLLGEPLARGTAPAIGSPQRRHRVDHPAERHDLGHHVEGDEADEHHDPGGSRARAATTPMPRAPPMGLAPASPSISRSRTSGTSSPGTRADHDGNGRQLRRTRGQREKDEGHDRAP